MRRYPPEVHRFIAENVHGRSTRELMQMVNEKYGPLFTESSLHSYKTNHKLKSGTPNGLPAGHPSKQYPEEIARFIQENHAGVGHKEMADMLKAKFGREYSVRRIKNYYGNHNLDSGLTGRFEKGHVPANKGQKGIRVSPATEFKKGHMPAKHRPVGSERVDIYGYTEVKVAEPKKWRMKHVVIWEHQHGPVPKGSVILFADGDKTNMQPENLILITRKQLARMNQNGLIQNDADLTRTGVIIADVLSKCGERKREMKKNKRVRKEKSA